jgi:hypothetical protein
MTQQPANALDPRLATRDDWRAGVVRSSQRAGAIIFLAFAAFWNLIAWGATIAFLLNPDEKPAGAYFVLIFPCVGILLAILAIHQLMIYRRWGVSTLTLESFPPRLGGRLRGLVKITRPIDALQPVRIQIRCVKITHHGSGKNRSTRRTILWENEAFVEAGTGSFSKGELPVSFRLPTDQPTFQPRSLEWELFVTWSRPGPDYAATFDLPVIEADPQAIDPVEPDAPAIAEIAAERLIEAHDPGVMITEGAGSTRIHFPAMRHLGMSLTFTIIGLAILAGSVVAFVYGVCLFVPLLLLLFGGLFAWAGLGMLLTSRSVTVMRSGIEIESKFLVITRMSMITPDSISHIDSKMTGSAGDRTFYDIVLHTVEGKRFTLGHFIRGRPATDALIGRINGALGK